MLNFRSQLRRKPVVAVLSTGDELVEPDACQLAPGQIRDSNRCMLLAALTAAGYATMDMGIVEEKVFSTFCSVESCCNKQHAVSICTAQLTWYRKPLDRDGLCRKVHWMLRYRKQWLKVQT
jgi:hypothetical protein